MARALRVIAISATLLVAMIAGALAGRAVASAILPDLDELSAIADALVPDEASDVSAHDARGTGLANVNIFRTPIPSEASRSFTPDGPPEEAVQTIRRELMERGWRASEADDDEFRDGRRTVVVNQNVWRAIVAVSYYPGLLSYLPTLTAASGGAAVLTAVSRRGKRRASRSSRSTAPRSAVPRCPGDHLGDARRGDRGGARG
jgi:hypothetical protein